LHWRAIQTLELKDLKSFGINNKKKFWGFGFRFFCT